MQYDLQLQYCVVGCDPILSFPRLELSQIFLFTSSPPSIEFIKPFCFVVLSLAMQRSDLNFIGNHKHSEFVLS
jgi:hypothetical protein